MEEIVNKLSLIPASKISLISQILSLSLMTGCLATTPKKNDISSGFKPLYKAPVNLPTTNLTKTKTITSHTKTTNDVKPNTMDKKSEYCTDRLTKASYTEDLSAGCIRNQTYKAYKVLGLKMDPEIPYCILRQESSNVKNNSDPFEVDFDRLGVCQKKSGTYCGVGLGGFTFGTWTGYETEFQNNPDKKALLEQCLNNLSSGLSNENYTAVKYNVIHMKTMSGSIVEDARNDAQRLAPSNELNPFYRDHAICMSMLHLTEIGGSSAAYNAGGTKGYSSNIKSCAKGLHDYDVAANSSFYLGEPKSTLIEASARSNYLGSYLTQNQSSGSR
jgi:hypothetical protein